MYLWAKINGIPDPEVPPGIKSPDPPRQRNRALNTQLTASCTFAPA